MRIIALAPALLLLLAGCTSPDLDAETYEVTVEGAPATADGPFTLHVHVDGDMEHTTDHVGVHYWNETVSDPDTEFSKALSCPHGKGDVPGEYDITCDVDSGTWYMRGHLRIEDGETKYDYWGEEFVVEVTRPLTDV